MKARALLRLCCIAAMAAIGVAAPTATSASDPRAITVASKTFTESYILGEIVAQLLESRGLAVERKLGLGGTLIAFEALRAGTADVYPEYSGTLAQAILGDPAMDNAALAAALDQRGLRAAVSLGFENSYALALHQDLARELGVQRISDLGPHPGLRAIFSHEFLKRSDGWEALRAVYGLHQSAVGIEHALAYDALEKGQADLTEAYTTDGELIGRSLRLLEDDLAFFPQYDALLLTRSDLPAPALAALMSLEHALDETAMRELNYRVAIGGESPAAVASTFLAERGFIPTAAREAPGMAARIAGNTLVHLRLTATALLLACLIALPAALLLSRSEGPARVLLYLSGLVQTIPALALLALLIPVAGLGELPAILALFLYSLLPIVRNTLTGLFSVDPLLKDVATGMGLTPLQRLRLVELPLAAPTILAGIKTAAIVSIGTATLAAFVGAGGLGEPIITGLNLNNHRLILEGAVPAALLAIAVEFLFELAERTLIPAHLRSS